MSSIQYNLIETDDGQEFLTVLLDGTLQPPIDDSHPNYSQIKEIVTDPFGSEFDACELADLFDLSAAISKRFKKLSERVTINGGTLYFDGDAIDGSVVETVVRFLDEGVDDWQPLVNYIEKIQSNPEEHSRVQLYDWLKLYDSISITPEGDIITYKGVSNGGKHPETGEPCYQSGFTGNAIVDGVECNGKIPYYVGAEVTMPRSSVAHDPFTHCHTGLHVGTFDYANSYAYGAMLAVRVNPRDVVSVPNDAGGQKIRVCRFVVEKVIEQEYTSALVDEFSGDTDGTVEGLLPKVGQYIYGYGSGNTYWEGAKVTEVRESQGSFVAIPQNGNGGEVLFFLSDGVIDFTDEPKGVCPVAVGEIVTYNPGGLNWRGTVLDISKWSSKGGSIEIEVDKYPGESTTCFFNEGEFDTHFRVEDPEPLVDVEFTDESEDDDSIKVGDFVKYYADGNGFEKNGFIGTVRTLDSGRIFTEGTEAIVDRPSSGIGSDVNVPFFYSPVGDLVKTEDPNQDAPSDLYAVGAIVTDFDGDTGTITSADDSKIVVLYDDALVGSVTVPRTSFGTYFPK